jgi:LmbE family N-acetylglucosaminyl deacetylase
LKAGVTIEAIKNTPYIFIPDGSNTQNALSRTTDLCIAAHQDDVEIMAYSAIDACYNASNRHFTALTVADGSGSPRCGKYAKYTDDEMKKIRIQEQLKAAKIGHYSVQILLSCPSAEIKKKSSSALINQLAQLISTCSPEIIYTHNLADKHDTHVAVALNVLAAIRSLSMQNRPKKLIGMEVWRSLDWLCDSDKVVMDTSHRSALAKRLLRSFDSQVAGGKDYIRAALGRRYANATFFKHHAVDQSGSLSFGLDMTELIINDNLSPQIFLSQYIDRFKKDCFDRLDKFE